ncbi:hypothetical protein SE957_03940 [Escherichia coli]|uniref:Shikimate transporter n=1 Tax=Escherichia coli TaxID=562 RepID=A0A377CFS9_ECOLX|nr:hypothetical protein [Escherichia coli]STL91569.1 shikimate transporter [Escherichia coli]
MDSTLISTRPDEGTLSLSRARRAALGSFAGAVVDWYDFYSMASPPHWCLIASFSRK